MTLRFQVYGWSARALLGRALFALWLCLLWSRPVIAQTPDRALAWPSIDVVAHLDADGRLQVRERQVMRLSGDWNGGERRFDVHFGQRLRVNEIVRIDSASHDEHALIEGDVSQLDHYEWSDGSTVRWRSRLPNDSAFNNSVLIYELRMTYENILEHVGGTSYRLAHDFVFADRDSALTHVSVTLTLDSAWRAPPAFTGHFEATEVPPGQGFVLTVPLTRVSSAPPTSVRRGADDATRFTLFGGLSVGLIVIFSRLFSEAARRGRFASPGALDVVTPEWLQNEVFSQPPETVGAAWDDRTGAPEVAATLARLVQEGKLASRVETNRLWVFSSHKLHLDIKVRRERFQAHEAALIDALFYPGKTATDTDQVRKRYRTSGFDPASVIRSALTSRVARMAPDVDRDAERAAVRKARLITWGLFGLALVLLVLGLRDSLADGLVVLLALGESVFAYVFARMVALSWRDRVTNVRLMSVLLVAPFVILALVFNWLLIANNEWHVGAWTIAALVVWQLALAHSVAASARSTQSPERVALRMRLATARAWFARELAKPQPQLQDAWYPYLLAFGLGSHVDKWFKSFGAAATSSGVTTHIASGAMSSSSGTSGASSFAGFGGGGGFSGGGGGMDFGSAIGGMASSVSSASSSSGSSSSSSFSSSSSSSSGGGGGGGW